MNSSQSQLLTASGRCGDFFTFRSSLVAENESRGEDSLSRLHVLIAVQSVLASGKSGFRCSLKIEHDRSDHLNGYYTDDPASGEWQPAAATLAPVHEQSVFAFALSNSPFSFYDCVRISKMIVTVERLPHAATAESPPIAIPAAIQLLRTTALLGTINNEHLCDCSLLPKDALAKPIHVSRTVLAHASPFFASMFTGPWAESAKQAKPIEFGWTTAAVMPSLIHIYSGWVPGQALPLGKAVRELVAKHALDLGALTLHQLLELMDLAQMLELPLLVEAANREMVKVLDAQVIGVRGGVEKLCKSVTAIGTGVAKEE